MGIIDRTRKYHLVGLCLTSNERQSEYEFVFSTIAGSAKKYADVEFQPEVLVSDAAFAIRNAYYSTFASAKHNVICWAHVARHIEEFKFENPDNKKAEMLTR